MGYFANGTEGDLYQAQWCERCVHYDNNDCPVWNLHLIWNTKARFDQDKELALDYFIPRTPDGLENLKCRMFHKASIASPRTQP